MASGSNMNASAGLESSKNLGFPGQPARTFQNLRTRKQYWHLTTSSSTCHSICCGLPPATSNSTDAWWLQMKICSRLKTHFKTMQLKEENWTWSKWMETSRCRSCRHRACLGMSSKQALQGVALVGWDKASEVQTLPFSKMQPMNTLGTSQIVLVLFGTPWTWPWQSQQHFAKQALPDACVLGELGGIEGSICETPQWQSIE